MAYIWIRRTVDWRDEAGALEALTHPRLGQRIALWNETFSITYQRFRQRLKEIAELNHARVEGAVQARWEEIPEGALVLPVDDDDWFAPDAARLLAELSEADVPAYVWPGRWFEIPISRGHQLHLLARRFRPSLPPTFTCSTNGYALTKSEDHKPLLFDHLVASRWYDDQLAAGSGRVKQIAGTLSVANRSLASLTSLRPSDPQFGRDDLLRRYRRYRRLYGRAIPDELAWSRPYVAMMAELTGELEVRGER